MGSNRRWVAMFFMGFGFLFWILVTKFIATVMEWIGIEEFDYQVIGERFTLTTLVGLAIAAVVTLVGYRHPRLSVLSNEVVVEMKKVTWPNSQETRGATVVVIITVFIMAVILGVFDLFWSNLMDALYPSVQSV
ncbi:MAG TPA: preprotein translocase subunit SecE [Myxococcota bacterium]|nr:preprotein translocase subunit SecE [Myxococcota bacterium]